MKSAQWNRKGLDDCHVNVRDITGLGGAILRKREAYMLELGCIQV